MRTCSLNATHQRILKALSSTEPISVCSVALNDFVSADQSVLDYADKNCNGENLGDPCVKGSHNPWTYVCSKDNQKRKTCAIKCVSSECVTGQDCYPSKDAFSISQQLRCENGRCRSNDSNCSPPSM